jgi:BirA family biotin operon repressor/biotin-[acetyl-CoA-carboxylase] ligase
VSGRIELLCLLADGELHSGEELAAALGISRAAVWKRLQQLEDWGIALDARAGSGYRLEAPMDLLDTSGIRRGLPQSTQDLLRHFEVHESLDSTSDRLLSMSDLPAGRFDACLAEFQTAGRGRRGRQWVAPFASGLCLSVNWNFRDAPTALGALSLAAGVAALRALGRAGFRGLSLKWPNDVMHGDDKLGGILIGINVRLPRAARQRLVAEGVEAVDLASLGEAPSRTALAGWLIAELAQALVEFEARGLAAFADEWSRADVLAGRAVHVLQGAQALEGIACGVDGDGALLLEAGGHRQRILSGEVSVRPVR